MNALTTRYARVRSVRTSRGVGLPGPGATLGFRFRPAGLGTYQYELETVDGATAPPLLVGFPVPGDRSGDHVEDLHRALDGRTGPLPAGFAAAAVWHGEVDLPDGRTRSVMLAPDPYADGFRTLHDTLLDGMPPRIRLELAYAVAGAVRDLHDAGAAFGGLNASTVLLRVTDRGVRIAETESVTVRPGRSPLAAGVAAGHLAPEAYDGLGEHPEAITAYADRWSLAVTVHLLLTGFHPYHFLADLSPRTIDEYLAAHTWPRHRLAAFAPFAVAYSAALQALPGDLVTLFARAFQQGRDDPRARPAAAEWLAVLASWIGQPAIVALHADRGCVLAGDTVTVSWQTRFAHRILIDGRESGAAAGSVEVVVDRPRRVLLRAIGPCGAIEAATGRIEVVRVAPMPMPDVRFPLAFTPGGGEPGDSRLRAAAPPVMRHHAPPPMPGRHVPPARPPSTAPPRPTCPAFPRRSDLERHDP
ncbi:hypothetical protein [Actinoplanes rectilineatus]|uniref:hypothetical protein n=1 Tax=Actinoplanes rectilineatus TaxID=113571 RepID=UPI0005F2DCFB|nr:hypothetical protein [Actinoplanes rectilineatus]